MEISWRLRAGKCSLYLVLQKRSKTQEKQWQACVVLIFFTNNGIILSLWLQLCNKMLLVWFQSWCWHHLISKLLVHPVQVHIKVQKCISVVFPWVFSQCLSSRCIDRYIELDMVFSGGFLEYKPSLVGPISSHKPSRYCKQYSVSEENRYVFQGYVSQVKARECGEAKWERNHQERGAGVTLQLPFRVSMEKTMPMLLLTSGCTFMAVLHAVLQPDFSFIPIKMKAAELPILVAVL